MAIQVVRNNEGNVVEFRGSSQPIYWNSALSAVVDSVSADTVNIINTTQSVNISALSGRAYEFYRIPYTEFRDDSNASFPTALSAVNYINEAANATVLTVDDSSGYVGFTTNYYTATATNITQLLSANVYTPIVASVFEILDENIRPVQSISNGTSARTLTYSSSAFDGVLSTSIVPGSSTGAVDIGTPGLDGTNSLTVSSSPVLFSLAGQAKGSFDSFRVGFKITPEENESNLDMRVVYVPNPSTVTGGVSTIELTRRAFNFAEGAGVEYTSLETFSFYAGDDLRDESIDTPSWDNSGFYFVEVKANATMEFELLSMTQFANR